MLMYSGPRQLVAGVAIVFFAWLSPGSIRRVQALHLTSTTAARIERRGTVNNNAGIIMSRNNSSGRRSSCSSRRYYFCDGAWSTAHAHEGLRSSAGDYGDATPGSDRDDLDSVADVGDMNSLLGAQAQQVLEFWRNRKPNPDLPPNQVIGLLMAALQKNNPVDNDGLVTVFDFSSGMCRRAVGGTSESFIKEARYSVFGATINCKSFVLDPMQIVGDRFATQVVNVVATDGRQRRFLWTLERQRRPPDMGKWLVYGVVSSDVDGMLTMDG